MRLGRPHKLLLRLGQITRETSETARLLQPDASISHFDVGKNLGSGKLLLQALRGFGLVGREGCDVDQGSDSAIRPGMGDQGAAVRVADKDHGSTNPPEAASDALHVASERVQAMLGAHHFVPVRLQCGDQLLEA